MTGWYRVIKTIKGNRYAYEQRTWREGTRVRTQSRYIGRADGETRLSALRTGASPACNFFRGGGRGSMPRNMTARQIVDYEIGDLGNSITIVEGVDLDAIWSERLTWLTETRPAAKQYGEVEEVVLVNFRVVARDHYGGVLVERF